jgi:hypothetical protein
MRAWSRSIFALLVVAGVLGAVPAYAAAADGPRCHIEFSGTEHTFMPPRGEFIVRSAGRRGALGVWKDRSGDRLRVRVDPGEGEASKSRHRVPRHQYQLVLCETVG